MQNAECRIEVEKQPHGAENLEENNEKQKSLMASAFGFYDAQPRPCHPERNEVESNAERDTQCRDLRAINTPLVDPQNACSVLTFKNQQSFADF